jgi:copper chaperone CopZ
MKNYISLLIAFSTLLFSCSNSQVENAGGTTQNTTTEIIDGTSKTEVKLAITGMMCAQACGGKIQQDLQSTAGVKSTSLDFIDGREQNVVTVEIDANTIQPEKLTEVVHSIADGKYRVISMQTIVHKAS